ncbi:MAG: energy-coupled thiamine transporter ThiT [Acetatifactor sp.]|nr:energy-coupled thiamine transporter ThiT [Acetatifactor sp.]
MSNFISTEDGYYALTTAGMILCGVLIAVLVLATALISRRDKSKRLFSTKQLVFCAMAIALGFATSYVRIFTMPWGGSVTLCSMLFVALIGYWYGPKIGLCAGFAYGLLQFLQDGGSYILSPLQACLDYIVAFAALGCSGFFTDQKNSLIKGYVAAILARGLFHAIGGYLYWMDYMPDTFPTSLAAIYPIAYNYSYILAEGVITVILLCLPPVKHAMANVKKLAVQ